MTYCVNLIDVLMGVALLLPYATFLVATSYAEPPYRMDWFFVVTGIATSVTAGVGFFFIAQGLV